MPLHQNCWRVANKFSRNTDLWLGGLPRSRRFVISGVAGRKDEHCEYSFLYSVSPAERQAGKSLPRSLRVLATNNSPSGKSRSRGQIH